PFWHLSEPLAWIHGELSTSADLLSRAADGFSKSNDNAARAESLVLPSHTLSSSSDLEGASRALNEALSCGIATKHRCRILMQDFWRGVAARRGGRALHFLVVALDLARAARPGE